MKVYKGMLMYLDVFEGIYKCSGTRLMTICGYYVGPHFPKYKYIYIYRDTYIKADGSI